MANKSNYFPRRSSHFKNYKVILSGRGSRKVILLVPLAIILPFFMGVKGIYYAEPIADISSVTIASITFLLTYKKILKARKK
ncbi:hypothetical protein [Fusobacterium mortiferum]|uniref:Uncharacterized protein n=1 Tax=Fusobacterium mortiferum TaxID=850 RepID=A0ABS2FYL7_FUSMR|nr:MULTISPECIES: hypothetical protein [Fusobacterium]MBM6874246.1 hypothetical protein [Fusobacterium mortiferum]MDO5788883.1 hypothetical protein [Fusobacterium sp.]